jgi:transcription elongation factor GreA
VAGIGRRVTIRLADVDQPLEYDLVGAAEFDAARGRISVDSPIGAALVGTRAGDAVEVETPRGERTVHVLAVGHAEP